MQDILDKMNDLALINIMELNSIKAKHMWICFKEDIPVPSVLVVGDDTIERVKSFKLLGL